MTAVGIIPARMASSRFPGKPMAEILGIPMIGHVYFRSKLCKKLQDIYVATCDREIAGYIKSIGGKPIMTSDKHKRASDRTAEAMIEIERQTGRRADIVVMIQGDEPMIHPKMIDEAMYPIIKDNGIDIVNLMSGLTKEEHDNPNDVKVVTDLNGFALYFSREPIPSWKMKAQEVPMYKQLGVMPFRRDFLIKFNELRPTPLEMIESVDMLRVLEHGYNVKMVKTKFETYSVDTPDDLIRVERMMKSDKLIGRYADAPEKP